MWNSISYILAVEFFSLVTYVQTMTGWSQAVSQPGAIRNEKLGSTPISSSSGRQDRWCRAWHQHLDWPHGANVCTYPCLLFSISANVVTQKGNGDLMLPYWKSPKTILLPDLKMQSLLFSLSAKRALRNGPGGISALNILSNLSSTDIC